MKKNKSLPRLHCDNCGTEVYVDKLRKSFIEMPCPICGESLLTKEDYKLTRKLHRISFFLKILFKLSPETARSMNIKSALVKVENGKASIVKTSDDDVR